MTSEATEVPSARYLITPLDLQRGDRDRYVKLLDFLVQHPSWLSVPVEDADARRMLFAKALTNPDVRVWEVWDRDGNFIGVLHLGDIRPLVTGTVHWVFIDGELKGKKQLLLNWFGDLFRDYEFQRLTLMIPEFVGTLVSYARTKLGFEFEGQAILAKHPALSDLSMENPHVWVAKQGSRRERSHWHDGAWHDVLVLRLLRDDYLQKHQTLPD